MKNKQSRLRNALKNLLTLAIVAASGVIASSCSTLSSVFGKNSEADAPRLIENPFGSFAGDVRDRNPGVILRSKRGDRSVEVQIPTNDQELGSLEFPMPSTQSPSGRGLASVNGRAIDESYTSQKPGLADREISRTFPQMSAVDDARRRQIESDLGLRMAEGESVEADSSYLARVDFVKQLFRESRFEAALIETDHLLKMYPTDPRLYEMRGTLYDKLGYTDLAVKAWNQSLKLNPDNDSLKRFMSQRRFQSGGRGVASP
jgi:tetratricopeptide (TPR) repeat protein